MPDDTAYIELTYDTKNNFGMQKVYTTVKADTKEQLYKLTIKVNRIYK